MNDESLPGPGSSHAAGERSVAAGSIGVAITGDNARVVMVPAQAAQRAQEVSAPPGLANLPGSASGLFVGRDEDMQRLRQLLASTGEAAVTQEAVSGVRAIHGLGGIGKTTLALHYAHRYRSTYTLVWWINAATEEQIIKDLATLTGRLCQEWATSADVEQRAAWALLWLQWHPGWLLVFDNIEDPDVLRHYLGMLPDGHHLATSRRATGWHAIAPSMPLGLLDPAVAADLLCSLAFNEREPTASQRGLTEELAEDLGYLPLALEQAGAYLHQTGATIDAYRRALGLMLAKRADGVSAERTIARIWNQTLAVIAERDPLTVTLLNTMAWIGPDDIPRTLLASLGPDPVAVDEALGVLHAYNMIAFTAEQGITIHRLVQTVLRTRSTPEAGSYLPGRQEAEEAVGASLPDDDDPAMDHTVSWERLLPHVIALAESAPPDNPASTSTAGAYHAAAQYLYRQGRDAHTIALRALALAQYEQVLGDTHPNTLSSRNNLAGAYEEAGNLARAIPLYETTLTQYEHVLGHTHPNTLTSRNNLAYAVRAAGDLKRAIPLYETTLTQYEQVLGDTHPSTLLSRNNLATAYEAAGDLKRAIPLYETTLTQYEQVLGHTHADTLTSRNNLAYAYQSAGDLKRAIPLYETTLTQREQVLGHTHPDTLTSRNNLATAYQSAGNLKRAVLLYETTLTQSEQVLGHTHPSTLSSRNNLATAYEAAGDLKRAIPLLETTLTQREQVLGDTHPSTLLSRNNLAHAYQSAGDLKRAIPLYETTLTQYEQVLGHTHPNTLSSRNNLASAREVARTAQQPTAARPADASSLQPTTEPPEQPE